MNAVWLIKQLLLISLFLSLALPMRRLKNIENKVGFDFEGYCVDVNKNIVNKFDEIFDKNINILHDKKKFSSSKRFI